MKLLLISSRYHNYYKKIQKIITNNKNQGTTKVSISKK